MEDISELIRVACEMRAAQRQHDQTKATAHRSVAKDWERKFDALLARHAAPEQPKPPVQGTLFG